jgi:hypothetical protein
MEKKANKLKMPKIRSGGRKTKKDIAAGAYFLGHATTLHLKPIHRLVDRILA